MRESASKENFQNCYGMNFYPGITSPIKQTHKNPLKPIKMFPAGIQQNHLLYFMEI